MRLGWDHATLNAADLARRAEAAGVAMVTVHGRTRCQFYKGVADWAAIRAVKQAVRVPVIANGDGRTGDNVRAMLEASGADGVMIGRGAYGAPWLLAELAEALDPGTGRPAPAPADQREIAVAHLEAMLRFYGDALGLKNARKHMGWYLDRRYAADAGWKARFAADRRAMLTADDPHVALLMFRRLFDGEMPERIAA
jgi:tRNA-dihydrouridine synthase